MLTPNLAHINVGSKRPSNLRRISQDPEAETESETELPPGSCSRTLCRPSPGHGRKMEPTEIQATANHVGSGMLKLGLCFFCTEFGLGILCFGSRLYSLAA